MIPLKHSAPYTHPSNTPHASHKSLSAQTHSALPVRAALLFLLLLVTYCVTAHDSDRDDTDYASEALLFQSRRLPSPKKFVSIPRQSEITAKNTRRINKQTSMRKPYKLTPTLITNGQLASNAFSKTATHSRNKVYRRRRRKKRPGVFLVPTTLYTAATFASPLQSGNRANVDQSSSIQTSSSSRSSFQTSIASKSSSIQAGNVKFIVGASERFNRSQAAVLMKQQYHRFRSQLPGGETENTWQDDVKQAENSGKSVSSGSEVVQTQNGVGKISSSIISNINRSHNSSSSINNSISSVLINGFKQQRSAGESTGTLQSGKLSGTLQHFFPADLLSPINRQLLGNQSPEQKDTNSSVGVITRLLNERLGPGARTTYDPSILVDFISLIALNKPGQENRANRPDQIPSAVLLNSRRMGGDISGRISQRKINLQPIQLQTTFINPRQSNFVRDDITKLQDDLNIEEDVILRISEAIKSHVKQNVKEETGITTNSHKLRTTAIVESRNLLDEDESNTIERSNQGQNEKNTVIESANDLVEIKPDPNENESTLDHDQAVISDEKSEDKFIVDVLAEDDRDKTGLAAEDSTSHREVPLLFSDLDHLLLHEETSALHVTHAAEQSTPNTEILSATETVSATPEVDFGNANESADESLLPITLSNNESPNAATEGSQFGPFSDGNDPSAGVSPPGLPPVLRASLYSYLLPRLMALAPLTETIPGVPGLDYPIMAILPYTNFYCSNMPWPGFYADTEARCQAWHLCDLDGRQASFLCPNGTIFNQAFMVCDWWYNSDCQAAPYLYPLNERLFQQPELPPPTQQHRTLTAHVLDTLFV